MTTIASIRQRACMYMLPPRDPLCRRAAHDERIIRQWPLQRARLVRSQRAVIAVWHSHSTSEHLVPKSFNIIPAVFSRTRAMDGPFKWTSNAASSR